MSFNRTAPRKNYRHNENVLDGGSNSSGQSPAELAARSWPAVEAADGGADGDGGGDGDSRGDGGGDGDGDSDPSGDSDDEDGENAGGSSRGAVSRLAAARQVGSSNGANNTASRPSSPCSSSADTNAAGKPSLRFVPSCKPCPVVGPRQMIDVERIAEAELGLTEDMMTENGGRGIATVAMQALSKRLAAVNDNPNALGELLVFAGNNKSGARAIAAGRHLSSHRIRVVVSVLGLEHEEGLLDSVRRQLNVFRNSGGTAVLWEEILSKAMSLDYQPELIIDGLLGVHIGLGDLRTDHRIAALKMVQFANNSRAQVLSIDVPSGIDGNTGMRYLAPSLSLLFSFPSLVPNRGKIMIGAIAQLEDTDAYYMRAKWVVCMGAPKTGLLRAVTRGIGAGWVLSVADIGISSSAWRRCGTRRRHGVEFCSDWVAPLNYDPGASTGK